MSGGRRKLCFMPVTRSTAASRHGMRAVPADPSTVERLKDNIGKLSTATLKQLNLSLPWYRGLRPDERSALGMWRRRELPPL